MDLPRFFLASQSEAPPAGDASWVIDSFVHTSTGAAPSEVIVALDSAGAMRLEPLEGAEERLSSIRAHLAHAEVATPQKRGIETAPGGLWLFALELVEQLPDAPGPNDLLYLYGALYAADDVKAGIKGQLTTTRADLLRGLAEGLPWAFRFPSDEHDRVPRSFHALLPGDRPDELQAGRGLVLAYPTVDPALLGDHGGNELAVTTIFYDVLSALLADRDHGGRPDEANPLPVPNREACVRDLEASGWTIEEDGRSASREPDGGGVLKRLFGGKERVRIPDEGTVDVYAQRAQAELARLAGWPTKTSAVLFSRVSAPFRGSRTRTMPLPAGPASHAGQPPPPTAPRPPVSAAPRASRDEWMLDFIEEHRERGPKLTPVRRPPADRRGRPDWIKDFE